MNKLQIVKILTEKRGYLKSGPNFIQKKFNVSLQEAREALQEARDIIKAKKKVKDTKQPITVEKASTPFVLNAWNSNTGKMMTIQEYCNFYNLDYKQIKSYKSVTHTSIPYYNIEFKAKTLEAKSVDIERAVLNALENYTEPFKNIIPIDMGSIEVIADRLIFTDVHIGMEPNPDNTSMFKHKWDKEELFKTADEMITTVLKNKKSDILIIDDLGDLPDGFQKTTSRGGHALPQNMSDLEIFNNAVEFKLYLVKYLKQHFTGILLNNVCEDNHGGSFTSIINTAVKKIIDVTDSSVSVTNHYDFFSHYFIGNHCKILCHGKDSTELKFGMGIKLTPEIAAKIEQYIDAHDLKAKARYIEFSKGDTHLCLFDMGNSDNFNYMNYPALSPSSKYIQHNYKKGRRGFVIEHLTNMNSSNHQVFWLK